MDLKKGRRPVERIDISINMEKTGANIRRLIKASGYSVRDIMKITGLSTEQAVYKWYRGDSIPALETQLVLCKVLGLDITELLVIDGDFYFFGYYRTAFATCGSSEKKIAPGGICRLTNDFFDEQMCYTDHVSRSEMSRR